MLLLISPTVGEFYHNIIKQDNFAPKPLLEIMCTVLVHVVINVCFENASTNLPDPAVPQRTTVFWATLLPPSHSHWYSPRGNPNRIPPFLLTLFTICTPFRYCSAAAAASAVKTSTVQRAINSNGECRRIKYAGVARAFVIIV